MPDKDKQTETLEYSAWWRLHLRRAKGESLSADDESVYLAERNRFEAEETKSLRPGLERLRELRAEVTRRESELIRLRTENDALKAALQQRETRLDTRTKQALGI